MSGYVCTNCGMPPFDCVCARRSAAQESIYQDEIQSLKAKLKKCKEGLEWYADPGNYLVDEAGTTVADAWRNDKVGLKAQKILKDLEGE